MRKYLINKKYRTMEDLKIFKNKEFGEIRIVEQNGEPWFVGKDVADVLGYVNTAKAVREHVDLEDKGVTEMDTPGGQQQITIINESGLYALILSSKLPTAKAFKRWVTSEVLPAIRRQGGYVTDEVLKRTLDDPDYMIKLLQNMKEDREARMRAERDVRSAKIVVEAQQAIIEENKPKVAFFDVYSRCKGSILVGEMAKMLVQAGVKTVTVLGEVKKMGQNNLFAWLRENHYLGIRGDYYNKPTQRATELNIFEIKNTVRTDYYGNVIPCPVVKINAKGQQYFVEKFLGMKFSPTPNPLSLIGIRG